MGITETISVFSERSITKNASIVLATPIYLGKCGPESLFWADITASGGGDAIITYQIGDTPSETFYTPANATACHALFKSSIGTASRDRVDISILGAPWIKFKAKENNASPVTLSMDLIVSK